VKIVDSLNFQARMPEMSEKYKVKLSAEQRKELERVSHQSSVGVARVRRAKILLMSDESNPEGRRRDWEIAEAVGISERQVVRIRQKFVRDGIEPTLTRAVRSDAGSSRVLDGKAEAHLVRLACSTPPEGRDKWTLELLCDELCRLQIVRSICRETVRQALKKTNLSLGRRSGSASPKRIGRGLSRGWRKSSTSTRKASTKRTR
jgi:hypothetical protein